MDNVVYLSEYLKQKKEKTILEINNPTDEQLAWQLFLVKFLDYKENTKGDNNGIQ